MKEKKKVPLIITIIIIAVLLFAAALSGIIRIHPKRQVPGENSEFIQKLGVGFNIGNSLDVCDWDSMFVNKYGLETQTLWWGPLITEDYVRMLSDKGFGVIRLPVTYMNHIDEDGNVDPLLLPEDLTVSTNN